MMKRLAALFVVGAMVLAAVTLWILDSQTAGAVQEILMAGVVLALVGLAVYI
jgi:hypothetical protein